MRWRPTNILFVAVAISLLAVGCERETGAEQAAESSAPQAEAGAADEADEDYFYSPFVVELEGGDFDTVSFKDVGLERDGGEPDEMLLEVIADSFAYEIASRPGLGYSAQMAYDEELLDPANHTHCGMNHLYIDLWQSDSPDRWGYSLWSGCSELDNFAWEEVADDRPDDDLPSYVAPLTTSIIDSLAEASDEGCFQKRC